MITDEIGTTNSFKMGSDLTKNVLQNLHTNFRYDTETVDVCFIFDTDDGEFEKKSLPAHKLILAGGSAVFRAMFYGELREAKNIPITDFSYNGFSEFINLFYLPDATVSKDNILEVIMAVDKYDVRGCLVRCEQFLLKNIDESNALDVLELAMKIKLYPVIATKATDVIGQNARSIFKSNGFLKCSKDVLTRILQMNTLICDNELAVFDAAMDWAGARCRVDGCPLTNTNKRTVLGECFQLIRFATMDATEFLEISELYPEVFSYEEFKEMLQHKLRGKPLTLFAELSSTVRKFKQENHIELLDSWKARDLKLIRKMCKQNSGYIKRTGRVSRNK